MRVVVGSSWALGSLGKPMGTWHLLEDALALQVEMQKTSRFFCKELEKRASPDICNMSLCCVIAD